MDKDKQARMVQLANAIERGNFNRDTKEEFRRLFAEAVTERIQAQLPAIEAEARRRKAAIEAGRRAGIAAGRQVARQFQQQRPQRFSSEAHRQAHDSIVRNRKR